MRPSKVPQRTIANQLHALMIVLCMFCCLQLSFLQWVVDPSAQAFAALDQLADGHYHVTDTAMSKGVRHTLTHTHTRKRHCTEAVRDPICVDTPLHCLHTMLEALEQETLHVIACVCVCVYLYMCVSTEDLFSRITQDPEEATWLHDELETWHAFFDTKHAQGSFLRYTNTHTRTHIHTRARSTHAHMHACMHAKLGLEL